MRGEPTGKRVLVFSCYSSVWEHLRTLAIGTTNAEPSTSEGETKAGDTSEEGGKEGKTDSDGFSFQPDLSSQFRKQAAADSDSESDDEEENKFRVRGSWLIAFVSGKLFVSRLQLAVAF